MRNFKKNFFSSALLEVRIGCHTHLFGGYLGSQMETLGCLALLLLLAPPKVVVGFYWPCGENTTLCRGC